MSNQQPVDNGDSTADAIAAVAVIAIIVAATVFWLSSF
jgi:hypothetical protein